jgi:hypothetical protein
LYIKTNEIIIPQIYFFDRIFTVVDHCGSLMRTVVAHRVVACCECRCSLVWAIYYKRISITMDGYSNYRGKLSFNNGLDNGLALLVVRLRSQKKTLARVVYMLHQTSIVVWCFRVVKRKEKGKTQTLCPVKKSFNFQYF